jgi:hypothetical protein
MSSFDICPPKNWRVCGGLVNGLALMPHYDNDNFARAGCAKLCKSLMNQLLTEALR